jgi:hypothetical protein
MYRPTSSTARVLEKQENKTTQAATRLRVVEINRKGNEVAHILV